MEREEIRCFLLSETKKEQEKIQILIRTKSEADGPRTSRSSHLHLDIEQDIAQLEDRLTRYQAILRSLDTTPSENIGIGSIVTLSIEGDVGKYLILRGSGGSVGKYFVLSIQSPIGKAIWGKRAGEEVEVNVPQGTMSIKILKVT